MKSASPFVTGLASACILALFAAGPAVAQSSTVTLETGYTDKGQAVQGSAATLVPSAVGQPADRSVAGVMPAAVNNLPVNAANPAASTPIDPALLPPGTLVVAPGATDAPKARATGPAPLLDPTSENGTWLTIGLLAVAAMAPLAGLLWVFRRKKPRAARPNAALAQALAAALPVEKPAPAPAPRLAERLRDVVAGGIAVATPPRARADVSRELAEALRRGPDAEPAADEAALTRLRQEVLEGLREMKSRVAEFTEALEIGKDELQSELARADRAVQLLRAEREGLEHSTQLAARRPLEQLAEPMTAAAPMSVRTPLGPTAFRPPRVEPAPPAERRPEPTLDPAWLLLEDEGDGLWSPALDAPARPAASRHPAPVAPSPRPAHAPMGVGAVKALAARPAAAPLSHESEDPRERRRRIVEMARNGRTIDDISRQLHVGRGEVTLALSRAR